MLCVALSETFWKAVRTETDAWHCRLEVEERWNAEGKEKTLVKVEMFFILIELTVVSFLRVLFLPSAGIARMAHPGLSLHFKKAV